jgi:hypothetical protein
MSRAVLTGALVLVLLGVLVTRIAFDGSTTSPRLVEGPLMSRSNPSASTATTGWRARLFTPTYVKRMHGLWFVIDCWHNRVLWRIDRGPQDVLDSLPLGHPAWQTLGEFDPPDAHSTLRIPHSVASDGQYFLIESSRNGSTGSLHAVFVYERVVEAVAPTYDVLRVRMNFVQEVVACGGDRARRPHRLVYEPEQKAFFLHLTHPAHMARLQVVPNGGAQPIVRAFCVALPFLNGTYARSIALDAGSMLITAGPGVIFRVNHLSASASSPPTVLATYDSVAMGGAPGQMNDVFFHDGWYYITNNVPCMFGRMRDLATRADADFSLARRLGLCDWRTHPENGTCPGTPYYLSFDPVGGRMYVPFIFACSGVASFVPGPSAENPVIDPRRHFTPIGWVADAEDKAVRGTSF